MKTKKQIVQIMALLISLCGVTWAFDTPTANLTERWTSSSALWTARDDVSRAPRSIVWNAAGAVGVKYTAVAVDDGLPLQMYSAVGSTNASSGCFSGNYNLRGIEAVAFDVNSINMASSPAFYFVSSSGEKWSFTLSTVPVNTGSSYVPISVPLTYSEQWEDSTGLLGAADFEAGKENVVEVGFATYRSSNLAQQFLVDNLRLVGPWGGSFITINNSEVSSAWFQEYGINSNDFAGDKDGDGFSNIAEYLAGTNPSDSNSFFSVSIGRNANGKPVVKWSENKYVNVTFDLMQATDLTDSSSFSAVTNLSSSGVKREVEIDDTGVGVRFYKVVVKPAVK